MATGKQALLSSLVIFHSCHSPPIIGSRSRQLFTIQTANDQLNVVHRLSWFSAKMSRKLESTCHVEHDFLQITTVKLLSPKDFREDVTTNNIFSCPSPVQAVAAKSKNHPRYYLKGKLSINKCCFLSGNARITGRVFFCPCPDLLALFVTK